MQRWCGELRWEHGTQHRIAVDRPLVVGRLPGHSDAQIEHVTIGRRHFLIVPVRGGALIGDLESPSGLYIGYQQVAGDGGPRRIDPTTALQVGALHLSWVPGEPHEVEPIDPRREAELAAGGDDPAPWLVHGDWLSALGDPRGELVAVQHRLAATAPHEREALAARDRELRDHLGAARLHRESWRLGYRRTAEARGVVEVARALWDPSSRFLEELSCSSDPRRRRGLVSWICTLLAEVDLRLRRLTVACAEPCPPSELAALAAAAPGAEVRTVTVAPPA